MIKITEDNFWDAVNYSNNNERADCLDFITIIYHNDYVETAYQVDTDAYEYVYVYEYNDERENQYYGTK